MSDRKKRRGIIEKRRRDRINNSLAELRRLVPTAFEKQGSAKLEKAEILQMTVDHLKVLHQKGLNGYNYPDPHALAMDYRSLGFRECAAEVARYLVTVEGMDIQDPLRLRLMSHLQCFSAQREAAAKASYQNSQWNMTTSPHFNMNINVNSQYSGNPMITSQQSTDQLMTSHHTALPTSCSEPKYNPHQDAVNSNIGNHHLRLPTTASAAPQMSSVASSSSSGHAQMPQLSSSLVPPSLQHSSQFSLGMNSLPMLSPTGPHNYNPSSSSHAVKPYRPWGSELAY
ncbi:hairy/enhancer-of-split related with YRPW motif protein 1 isoform X3 [Lingula anatina]|nr:hairy/enhancer-of-split related with YRPW motif protein 1 isoform X2 [Lingula anatina]XP_013414701.1 hairy/enhancer-of-split related with YRPW motif protein 1 isoform X3 [Lingula anatina]|eukprot:XP_013414700.1 hairy/enhancer-of-split related with YRPW motif protein 1 isoform X2 [Lingula anatina]